MHYLPHYYFVILFFFTLALLVLLIFQSSNRAQRRTEPPNETTIPILKLSDNAIIPKRVHTNDIGFDLYSVEEHLFAPQEHKAIGTGLAIHLPDGIAGFVIPRSGLAAKHAITVVNSPGLVDPGYRGEIKVILQNTGEEKFQVSPGDRIAQFVFVATLPANLPEVERLEE